MRTTMARQRGVVLIIALVILLALTILGVSSMTSSTLEERMAANYRDREIAFQAAEAALREGERYVQNNNMDPAFFSDTCETVAGLCDCSDPGVGCEEYWTYVWPDGYTAWNKSTRHRTYNITFAEVAEPAKYIIEFMGYTCPGSTTNCSKTAGDPQMFRITALGTGQTPGAKVMLQSTYRKD